MPSHTLQLPKMEAALIISLTIHRSRTLSLPVGVYPTQTNVQKRMETWDTIVNFNSIRVEIICSSDVSSIVYTSVWEL